MQGRSCDIFLFSTICILMFFAFYIFVLLFTCALAQMGTKCNLTGSKGIKKQLLVFLLGLTLGTSSFQRRYFFAQRVFIGLGWKRWGLWRLMAVSSLIIFSGPRVHFGEILHCSCMSLHEARSLPQIQWMEMISGEAYQRRTVESKFLPRIKKLALFLTTTSLFSFFFPHPQP